MQVKRQRSGMFTLFFTLLLLATSSAPAFAFDLVSAEPAVDSTITTSPGAVTLTFTSDVTESGSSLSVRAPSGMAVDDGSLLIDGANALIGLKKLTEGGQYTVTYQFVSIEGEILNGKYFFTYDAPAEVTSPTPTPTIITSPEANQETPAEATGKSSRATDIFMIALLVVSFLVLIFIGRTLRTPKNKKRKKK